MVRSLFTMSSFYVQLPSNSSMEYFPNNTVANFKTQLRQPIELDGEWEVGLSELVTPTQWKNVDDEGNNFFSAKEAEAWSEQFTIPPGYYANNEMFIKYFKSILQNANIRKVIGYNDRSRRIEFKLPAGMTMRFQKTLGRILGYHEGENTVCGGTTVHPPNTVDVNHGVHTIYVYCDIVAPQIVGDTEVPLLRIVKMENHGEVQTITFEKPHYVPVSSRNITSIEIHIKDDYDTTMPYIGAKSIVKLHFRRRKYI